MIIGRGDSMKQIHAIVSGRVQGVGFRHFTQMLAEENDVLGWVKNRADGSVEMRIQGTDRQLDAFLAKVKKGPNFFSKVKNIEISEEDFETKYESFEIKY